jgi:hypothetical protein
MSDTSDGSHLLAAAPVHASWPDEEDLAPASLPLLGTILWAARSHPEEGA